MSDILPNIINIAPRGIAIQSSFSEWSYDVKEANYALTGYGPKGWAFHTGSEIKNWWCVDLGKLYCLHSLRVHNRPGFNERYRNRTLKVVISPDLETWITVGELEFGEENHLAYLDIHNTPARFLKITSDYVCLNFQLVEIFTDFTLLPFRDVCLVRDAAIDKKVIAMLEAQNYESCEIDSVLRYADENDSFLELGASLGVMSTCVKKHFPACSYMAIEANPDLIPIIQRNHDMNAIENISVCNACASNKNGLLPFYVHKQSWASSLTPFPNPKAIVEVQSETLNDLTARSQATFLICDIEGAEYDIFTDTTDFGSIRKICIEVHAADSSKTERLHRIFSDNGFKCVEKHIKPPSLQLGVFVYMR